MDAVEIGGGDATPSRRGLRWRLDRLRGGIETIYAGGGAAEYLVAGRGVELAGPEVEYIPPALMPGWKD